MLSLVCFIFAVTQSSTSCFERVGPSEANVQKHLL